MSKSSDAEYVSRVNRLFIGYTRSHLYDIMNSAWKHKVAIINEIQSDDIWEEVRRSYSPANLPLVSKSIYKFMLSSSAWLLYFGCV